MRLQFEQVFKFIKKQYWQGTTLQLPHSFKDGIMF